jgi:hypothetical protein
MFYFILNFAADFYLFRNFSKKKSCKNKGKKHCLVRIHCSGKKQPDLT